MEEKIKTCASCGAEVTDKCKKANNPLEYKRGKTKVK